MNVNGGDAAPSGIASRRLAVSAVAVGLGALQLGGVAAAAPAAAPSAPAQADRERTVGGTSCTDDRIRACVDLSENKTWLLDGKGNVVHGPVPNSHGGEGKETPTGDFVVQWKNKHHRSSIYNNAPMPNSVFFDTEGRAFHGGSLDRESAGCVRLNMEDSERFFEHLNPNDRVQIVD